MFVCPFGQTNKKRNHWLSDANPYKVSSNKITFLSPTHGRACCSFAPSGQNKLGGSARGAKQSEAPLQPQKKKNILTDHCFHIKNHLTEQCFHIKNHLTEQCFHIKNHLTEHYFHIKNHLTEHCFHIKNHLTEHCFHIKNHLTEHCYNIKNHLTDHHHLAYILRYLGDAMHVGP
ncbi:hypothetical protein Mtc_2366 [Methanocella conradii HZ254]|uniref:Uncharacterized protein n=1 Tax=Methanocella conradii (strain DSM 24694 / JCM 17849 / CGMCC 1.5162 / HZ254) TaxID=1041930 RepID=H8I505_METCZ|nr:hypothetical protein Mtc_2366 [Methanocella conradii HZ254]